MLMGSERCIMWQSSGAGAQPCKDDGRLPCRAHALGAALGASRPHHAGADRLATILFGVYQYTKKQVRSHPPDVTYTRD